MTDDQETRAARPEFTAPLADREWLASNGIGGYSYLPLDLRPQRKYHTYFCAALEPPFGRVNLLADMEETVQGTGGPVALSHFLQGAGREPTCITFYEIEGQQLQRLIYLINGENTLLLRYRAAQGNGQPLALMLRPLFALRNHHQLQAKNDVFQRRLGIQGDRLCWRPFNQFPEINVACRGGRLIAASGWQEGVCYPQEAARGYPCHEDHFWPCLAECRLAPGEVAELIVSLHGRGGEAVEELRRQRPRLWGSVSPEIFLRSENRLGLALSRSSSLFLTRETDHHLNLLAGYPWFESWGRDALISLPGLCLTCGRFEEAKEILLHFREQLIDGLVPLWHNSATAETSYESVDTSLWYIYAVERYLAYTGDNTGVRRHFFEALLEILQSYLRGTLFEIKANPGGLLWHDGGEALPLTWMDVRWQGRAVNPRRGYAVEINALWYNALRTAEDLCGRFGCGAREKAYGDLARQARQAFAQAFVEKETAVICDVVHPDGNDRRLRPNALYAFGLPFPVLDAARHRPFLERVHRELVTPAGLRTLSPNEPGYRGRCEGGDEGRELAYHNGTAWPFLFPQYWTAVERAFGEAIPGEYRQDLKAFLQFLHMEVGQGALGQINEFFDGDAPHAPRGAVAQAWSAAEVLRLLADLDQKASPA